MEPEPHLATRDRWITGDHWEFWGIIIWNYPLRSSHFMFIILSISLDIVGEFQGIFSWKPLDETMDILGTKEPVMMNICSKWVKKTRHKAPASHLFPENHWIFSFTRGSQLIAGLCFAATCVFRIKMEFGNFQWTMGKNKWKTHFFLVRQRRHIFLVDLFGTAQTRWKRRGKTTQPCELGSTGAAMAPQFRNGGGGTVGRGDFRGMVGQLLDGIKKHGCSCKTMFFFGPETIRVEKTWLQRSWAVFERLDPVSWYYKKSEYGNKVMGGSKGWASIPNLS